MKLSRTSLPAFAILASTTAALLTGCGVNSSSITTSSSAGAALQGHVHGGQQPISGASVYLYQSAAAASGASSTSLLTTSHGGVFANAAGFGTDGAGNTYVVTDSNGNFTFNSANSSPTYQCTAGQDVYALAIGGNPGLQSGTNNPAIALIASLGLCPSGSTTLSSSLTFNIDEASTVAAVYSLAGFMTSPTQVASGTSANSLAGFTNAVNNVNQLVDLTSGIALTTTPGGNGAGIVPTAAVDTLANIVAACVNSDGSLMTTGSNPTLTSCGTLFTNASGSGTEPSDTATALLNIAHFPAANIANLFSLSSSTAPFQPSLSQQPNDFTLSIGFPVASASAPGIPAVDVNGNVWFPSEGPSTLVELSPQGSVLSATSPLSGTPTQVAIDPNGGVWEAFQNTGSIAGPSGVINVGAAGDDDHQIAIDPTGAVYVSDYTNSTLYKLNNNGTAATGFTSPVGYTNVAFNNNGDFLSLNTTPAVAQFNVLGIAQPFGSVQTLGPVTTPTYFAADAQGDVFVANSNSTIDAFNAAGTQFSASPFTGGGLTSFFNVQQRPTGLAVDGAGNIWAPNYGNPNGSGGSISEFSNAGSALSPATGYVASQSCPATGLAVDNAGNVWVSCSPIPGSGPGGTNYPPVQEFIGAATPVSTPLIAGHLGQLP